MDLRPIVVVSVMVVKDGKLLLNFRKGSFAANQFGTAGGKLDNMESFQQCAERECSEEAGLKIGAVRFVCVFNNHVHNPNHFVTIGVVTDWVSGEPTVMEPEKCVSWGWYDFDHLPSPLTEVTKCLVKAYKDGGNYFDAT
ncbi:MAG: NUDIX domain-containing protein [Patescibacteria group bacterium]